MDAEAIYDTWVANKNVAEGRTEDDDGDNTYENLRNVFGFIDSKGLHEEFKAYLELGDDFGE